MADKIDFVLVTLADPTAPEGTVQLLRLPALVQALHEDKSADLTVFANAPVAAIKGGPVFLLEKIPLDATHASAPSYAREEEPVAAPIVARATAATATTTAPKIVHSPPETSRRVFGKGQAGRSSGGTRSSAIRRFESGSVSAAKGTASAEQILRSVGEPKANLPGQQPRRVFMKGKGEIKSRNHQPGLGASHEDPPINPEIDPMGALAQMMDKPISPEEALLLGEAAPSPGEVPIPDPLAFPPPSPRQSHANGKPVTTGGQPV